MYGHGPSSPLNSSSKYSPSSALPAPISVKRHAQGRHIPGDGVTYGDPHDIPALQAL